MDGEDTKPMFDPENQTSTTTGPSNGINWNITTKKGLIITAIIYTLTIISLASAIGVATYFLLPPKQEAATVAVQETTESTVTVTVNTNGTMVNETITIFVNGTYVNQTVTVFINGTCINDTSTVDDNGVMVNQTTTICTNGTYVNQTMTVFQNGTFKNVTRQRFVNGTTMNVTMMVTEVIDAVYSWWQPNNWEYALNGHDTVEYFSLNSDDNAVDGDDAFVTEIYGTKWRFKDQANKDLFDANPAQYVPAYGAHCAFAMASNGIASGDPDAWTVYNGVLYINLNTDIRTSWQNKIDSNINKGDGNWANRGFDNPH